MTWPTRGNLGRYSDTSDASVYAMEALQLNTGKALISSMSNDSKSPVPRPRPRVATILMRFVQGQHIISHIKS